MSVSIVRSGVLISISGLTEDMMVALQRQLQYSRHGMAPDGYGGLEASSENVRMWSLQDDGSLVTNCGFLSRVYRVVESMGGRVQKCERVDRDKVLHPDMSKVDISTWRKSQVEMLSFFIAFEGGLIVCPTGSGKSYGMREICAMYSDARIVIVAPGIDPCRTVARYVRERLPGEVGEMGGGRRRTNRITVSTFESLSKVDYFNEIDILIVDEVHKAPAETYSQYLSSLTSPIKRFGFTATPEGRYDNADFVNEGLFGPVVIEIPYYVAVARGEVVPIHCIVHYNYYGPSAEHIRSIRSIPRRDKIALWRNHGRNQMIVDDVTQILAEQPDIQILVMVSKVDHLYHLYSLLEPLGFEAVTGNLTKSDVERYQRRGVPITYHAITNTKKRDWQRREFELGNLRRVISTEVWAQAVSADECSVAVFAAGSGSSINCLQTLGRASRVQGQGKTHGTYLIYRDMFYDGYKRRSDTLIRALKKQGHLITEVR